MSILDRDLTPTMKGQIMPMVRPLKNVQFCSISRKAKILTGGIHGVFRGVRFEPDAEIGEKRRFFKGLMKGKDQ